MNRNNPIFHSLAMIEEKLQEKLTVAYLAGGIHVSKYHYQRLFREAVGDSVMRYVTRRRLTLVAGELSGTEASVLEIALRYSFDSPEGFSRSFKAYLGVTPSEYRKRHALPSPNTKKEDLVMPHTAHTTSMIQDLNHLISQARETAAYLRRMENLSAAYAPFWNLTASRTDAMADGLAAVLDQINTISRRPDGISARFTLLRAIEGTAFRSRVTAFQAGLMVSRATPELRDMFHPACERCDALAQNAQLSAERLAGFFRELSALIFQDMREEASRLLLAAAEAGRAAAMPLSPVPYYAYIADELQAVTDTLSATPLEEITVSFLEEQLFRLDTVSLAAEADILRAPDHRPLFHGIVAFHARLDAAAAFFENLSADFTWEAPEPDSSSMQAQHSTPASWENVLLFYLKGEVKKLGNLLSPSQQASLDAICGQLDAAIRSVAAELLQQVSASLSAEAGQLGPLGGPLSFIAEEISRFAP